MLQLFILPIVFRFSLTHPLSDDQSFLTITKKDSSDPNGIQFKNSPIYEKLKSSNELTGDELFLYRSSSPMLGYNESLVRISGSIDISKLKSTNNKKIKDLLIFADERQGVVWPRWNQNKCKFDKVHFHVGFQGSITSTKLFVVSDRLDGNGIPNINEQKSIGIEPYSQRFYYYHTALIWANDVLKVATLMESKEHRYLSVPTTQTKIVFPVVSATQNVMKLLDFYVKEGKAEILPIPLLPLTDEFDPNENSSTLEWAFRPYYSTTSVVNQFWSHDDNINSPNSNFSFFEMARFGLLKKWYRNGNEESEIDLGDIIVDKKEMAQLKESAKRVVSTLKQVFGSLPEVNPLPGPSSCVKSECSNPIRDCYEKMITKEDWVFAQPSTKSHWIAI